MSQAQIDLFYIFLDYLLGYCFAKITLVMWFYMTKPFSQSSKFPLSLAPVLQDAPNTSHHI